MNVAQGAEVVKSFAVIGNLDHCIAVIDANILEAVPVLHLYLLLQQAAGKESFDVFSHRRAVVTTPTWIDIPFRYMPYKMFSLVKKLL